VSLALKVAAALGGVTPPVYVDDVFSAYVFNSINGTSTIVNGVDLATYGGMVCAKHRQGTDWHRVQDSARGVPGNQLYTNDTSANGAAASYYVQSLTSSGFTFSCNGVLPFITWSFRNAYNFFQVLQVTKVVGSNKVIDLSPYMAAPGMVKVKRTDAAGSWYVWHRSLTAGKLLIGETTAAEATDGSITVSGTTLTLVDGVIADGDYHIEAYAHDTSANGLIQCGTFTALTAFGTATITPGFESQYIYVKRIDGGTEDHMIFDTARGLSASDGAMMLRANTSGAEANFNRFYLTATGANAANFTQNGVYAYVVVRRPNKPPTSGTQVFNAISRNGTGAAATVTGVGFAPDLALIQARSGLEPFWHDRLRGSTLALDSSNTGAETNYAGSVTSFDMDGFTLGNFGNWNGAAVAYINWFFKRAPGVFDMICTDGSGSNKTEAHNLAAAAELWMGKRRNNTGSWIIGSKYLAATEKIVCPSPAGKVTDAIAWNSTYPTSSVISLGTLADVNAAGGTYAFMLWASLAGISKVFQVTKTAGADLNVNCGFSGGARFVMLFRTDAAGDIYIFDTVRGIVSGNDPYLLLNTTAAEVTGTDYIDPYAAGFTIVDGGLPNGDYGGIAYA
jgi:hypothetical protein